jgi:hypothetical protein
MIACPAFCCLLRLRSYNAFSLEGTFDYADVIFAWDDCIAELDHQKAATNTPDMKMVVSMSFSSDGDVDVVANYLKKVSVQRPDILWVAASGNDNNTKPNYPAMSPEVVSVAAVDWNGNKAYFSNYGPTVEWCELLVLRHRRRSSPVNHASVILEESG